MRGVVNPRFCVPTTIAAEMFLLFGDYFLEHPSHGLSVDILMSSSYHLYQSGQFLVPHKTCWAMVLVLGYCAPTRLEGSHCAPCWVLKSPFHRATNSHFFGPPLPTSLVAWPWKLTPSRVHDVQGLGDFHYTQFTISNWSLVHWVYDNLVCIIYIYTLTHTHIYMRIFIYHQNISKIFVAVVSAAPATIQKNCESSRSLIFLPKWACDNMACAFTSSKDRCTCL